MKAMILAAGRGERMRPLTDTLPKPLLRIAGKSLIEYHIENLVNAGITDLVINHAWLGDKIEALLGDGSHYGACIQYSKEQQALETAGGIHHALALLGNSPFIVVNGDIFTDYPFTQLIAAGEHLIASLAIKPVLAHLVLVNNPPHNPQGDFYCRAQMVQHTLSAGEQVQRYTFSGIACYHPDFFCNLISAKQALAPLLRNGMTKQQVSGEIYHGYWSDIGTPERLQEIQDNIQDI